jgi:acyl-CoA synthetase (AMP-forming)/AMP-acid ligase II
LLVQSIESFGVTNICGSPALLRVLGEYTSSRGLKLPRVKWFISAGAAVPIDAIRAMSTALNDDARIFTPYGATECLPVASISSAELDPVVTERTRRGEGICVGKPVDPNRVRILAIKDEAVEEFDDQLLMPTGVAGEIIVNGPTTTDAYWQREEQTRLAKITDDQGAVWHRMGDIGYFDSGDRLWYCGRKSQRIETENGTLFADQVEAVFNTHPEVFRTALVGISEGGKVKPALCVELKGKHGTKRKHRIETDLLQMAGSQTRFSSIAHVFFHPGFPVDIRHNSKIGREKLGHWASEQMA